MAAAVLCKYMYTATDAVISGQGSEAASSEAQEMDRLGEDAREFDVAIATVDFAEDAKEGAIRRLSVVLEKLGANSDNWKVDARGVWWEEAKSWVRLLYVGDDACAVAALKKRSENGDLFVGYVDVEIVLAPSPSFNATIQSSIREKLGPDWDVEERYAWGHVKKGVLSYWARVWYCGDPTNAGASTAVDRLVGNLKSMTYGANMRVAAPYGEYPHKVLLA